MANKCLQLSLYVFEKNCGFLCRRCTSILALRTLINTDNKIIGLSQNHAVFSNLENCFSRIFSISGVAFMMNNTINVLMRQHFSSLSLYKCFCFLFSVRSMCAVGRQFSSLGLMKCFQLPFPASISLRK